MCIVDAAGEYKDELFQMLGRTPIGRYKLCVVHANTHYHVVDMWYPSWCGVMHERSGAHNGLVPTTNTEVIPL